MFAKISKVCTKYEIFGKVVNKFEIILLHSVFQKNMVGVLEMWDF